MMAIPTKSDEVTRTRSTKALVVSRSSGKSSDAVVTTTPEETSSSSTTAAMVETTTSDGRNVVAPTASGVFRTTAESLASTREIFLCRMLVCRMLSILVMGAGAALYRVA